MSWQISPIQRGNSGKPAIGITPFPSGDLTLHDFWSKPVWIHPEVVTGMRLHSSWHSVRVIPSLPRFCPVIRRIHNSVCAMPNEVRLSRNAIGGLKDRLMVSVSSDLQFGQRNRHRASLAVPRIPFVCVAASFCKTVSQACLHANPIPRCWGGFD